ncbi:MAG: bifunctional folylpolyglutamate synthase/dihydrofolate synthase, partial [Eggerthellaceae bacterium]|nr:bifunctional folylpolyglutamate synthase/dihydrofolate synthase [Eggerthellaceae bacterium]
RITVLLEKMGNPQEKLRFVHVAGTNGKGSTCAFLAQILQEAGLKTGLFTSPYIIEFSDRIRVDGENITLEELRAVTLIVKEAADTMDDYPTEFELMTAVAFLHFMRQECDIVVCEVGLGGRLDSTNVIAHPELCIIAPIGLDHMEYLGNTIAAIAGEKAGIIKQGVPVLSWPQKPEAMEVIERVAGEHDAALYQPDFSQLRNIMDNPDENGFLLAIGFDYKELSGLQISLLGSYQPFNAVMAIEAAWLLRNMGWAVGDDAIRDGLEKTRWPGRFEVFSRTPAFIIDGGHNADGAQALVDSLQAHFPRALPVFVVGILADKEYEAMLRKVLPYAAAFVTITPPNPRALPAADLAESIRRLQAETGIGGAMVPVVSSEDIPQALAQARTIAGASGLIVAFGSLYSVGAIKKAWQG